MFQTYKFTGTEAEYLFGLIKRKYKYLANKFNKYST